jgi:hypothetical protein
MQPVEFDPLRCPDLHLVVVGVHLDVRPSPCRRGKAFDRRRDRGQRRLVADEEVLVDLLARRVSAAGARDDDRVAQPGITKSIAMARARRSIWRIVYVRRDGMSSGARVSRRASRS